MLVRFTKNAPAARADTLTCVRPDGSSTQGEMPRQGILPHHAFHFVLEGTLGWHDALFGQLARGATLDQVTPTLPSSALHRAKNTQARQSAALVACLEATQWGGAPDPAAFAENLVATCRRRHVPPPDIDADELARVRLALRAFGAAWRPLNPGQSLERTF